MFIYFSQHYTERKKDFPRFGEKSLLTFIPSIIDKIFIFFIYRKGEQLWHRNS